MKLNDVGVRMALELLHNVYFIFELFYIILVHQRDFLYAQSFFGAIVANQLVNEVGSAFAYKVAHVIVGKVNAVAFKKNKIVVFHNLWNVLSNVILLSCIERI